MSPSTSRLSPLLKLLPVATILGDSKGIRRHEMEDEGVSIVVGLAPNRDSFLTYAIAISMC